MSPAVLFECWPLLAAIAGCALVAWRLRFQPTGSNAGSSLLRLSADERGAVQSLSFVLTLPVFVMLMLFIVQLSQLTIARIVVEYAAFAAARSAIVWIPTDLGDELESANRVGLYRQSLGTIRDENDHFFDRYRLTHPSRKLQKIEQAAAQALMSVCPSRDVGASQTHPGMLAFSSLERTYRILDPNSANPRVPIRLRNKLAYALASTTVEVEIRHKDTEPPLMWHDIRPYREEFADNEIGWQDQVLVTVRHDFALLPGPARLLAKRVIVPGRTSDEVADRIAQRASVFVYPLSATVRLGNEGEKSVLSYVQR